MMLNWKIRYSKIIKNNPDLLDSNVSVLEVGCGGSGIAPYLKRPIVGLDQVFPPQVNEFIKATVGSVLDMAFPDNAFDIVICVDVLEHLPKQARERAIAEMIRVAKEKIIVSCPIHPMAEAGERQLLALFGRLGAECPAWLREHLDNGLPTIGELLAAVGASRLQFEIQPNESMVQHYAGVVLDSVFPMSQFLLDNIDRKYPDEIPIADCYADYYYSYIISIWKEKPAIAADRAVRASKTSRDTKIYVVYHLDLPTDHLQNLTPIYVGEAARAAAKGRLTDRLADGTALDNARWSELSAIYKIWKDGPRTDLVGFCHYRRLFRGGAGAEREVRTERRDLAGYRIDDGALRAMGDDFIVTPTPVRFGGTNFDHYGNSHNINDLCAVYNRTIRQFPQYIPVIIEQAKTNHLYANNMFITTWKNFDELCSLWFDVLQDFEATNPGGRADRYQNRDISFLAERLFDLWVRQKRRAGTKLAETGIHLVQFESLDVSPWTVAS
jgi:hypothetical protein